MKIIQVSIRSGCYHIHAVCESNGNFQPMTNEIPFELLEFKIQKPEWLPEFSKIWAQGCLAMHQKWWQFPASGEQGFSKWTSIDTLILTCNISHNYVIFRWEYWCLTCDCCRTVSRCGVITLLPGGMTRWVFNITLTDLWSCCILVRPPFDLQRQHFSTPDCQFHQTHKSGKEIDFSRTHAVKHLIITRIGPIRIGAIQ